MFRVAKNLLPALWWIYLIIFKKISCDVREGRGGSSPDYPNITQTKFNYTWIISVPEDHHVHLTLHIPVPLPQAGSYWMTVRDGMFPWSRHIGYFGSAMNIFPAKPWSVLSSGKDLWVNVNTCGFNYMPMICHFSFKAVNANETRCRAGWIQYGNDCFLLSSEITPGSLADPKESCTRRQAKTFRVEKTFCHLDFFAYQLVAFIRFQLRDIFCWGWREPLENCTSLLNMCNNGIRYSQCQRRIYFACVQGEGSISNQVSPVVSHVSGACSSVQVAWELPPVEVVCSRNIHYVMEINSSELNSPIKNELLTELCAFGWGLERNKTYSVQLTAFSLSGKALGSPWRREVTITPSGGSPYLTITNGELYKLLKQGYRMEKPSFCSDEMYQIMKACWNERASERPTFGQLRQTLEQMLQKDVPYLELSQIDNESMNYYSILDVNNHAGLADVK